MFNCHRAWDTIFTELEFLNLDDALDGICTTFRLNMLHGLESSTEMITRQRRSGVFAGDIYLPEFCEYASSGVGKLAVVVFILLVAEAFSADSLNSDGFALLEFQKAITSDPQNALRDWDGSHATPCSWTGISCRSLEELQESKVVDITLPRYALGGTLSPSLGDLAYLETLNLDTNKLTGRIPPELFNAVNLTRLYLSNNVLTGDIPAEIRNTRHQLRVLELRGNGFTGLPEDLSYCYQLQQLLIDDNIIAGPLPIGVGSNWTHLERLDLSMNLFHGNIPDDFGNFTALQGTLNLSSNRLSGSIPQSLAKLHKVFIDFSNNNLSGPIPNDSYFRSLGEPAFIGNAALCGSPLKTECSPSSSPAGFTATGSSLSKGAVIGVSVGCGAAGLLAMATLVLCLFLRKWALAKKTFARSDSALRGCLCSWRDSGSRSMSGEEEEGEGELAHLSGVLSFSLEELLRASAYVLGKSGVGIVYKAVLDDGTVVAVRRLGAGGEQRQKEFEAEVKTIAQVRHPNIVCLHSFCWTTDEKLLIYDYLSNGSLEMALQGGPERSKGFLTWEARLRIARGVAQGIAHIHECGSKHHIHGDIKPANILLDAFLEARIGDFGLRRLLALVNPEPLKEFGSTRDDNGTRLPAPAAAEIGRSSNSPTGEHMVAPLLVEVYRAPEAVHPKGLTQKSDVYSFGIVLLELLTGRSPFQQQAAGELDLVSWMRSALQEKKTLAEVFDPRLLDSSDEHNKMIETLQVALACMAVDSDSRPKMKQVAELFERLASS